MSLQKAIEDAGLSTKEAQIYLALLDVGRVQSGALIAKTKLQPSVVFHCLHALRDRGLVTTMVVGKRTLYSAAHPDVDQLSAKKQRFEDALPKLLAKKIKPAEEGAELYEGLAGIQNLFYALTNEAKEGDVAYYFDAEEHEHTAKASLVYLPFHTRMREKNLVVKGIHRTGTKTKATYLNTADCVGRRLCFHLIRRSFVMK